MSAEVSPSTAQSIPFQCFKDKPVYSGFDNSFTRFDDQGACYEIEIDGGALPPIQIGPQPTFSDLPGNSAWTQQIRWMSSQIAQQAAIFGYEWVGEVLFVNNGNPTDLSGIDDIAGAPTEELAQIYIDAGMRWRMFQITVCPGSPSPTAWRRTKGGTIYAGSANEERELLITKPIPGPIREFQVCAYHDGKSAFEDFYLVQQPGRVLRKLDPVANANEMPRCLVPCSAASQIAPPSQPTTLFDIQLACDDGNQIGTDGNGDPVYQEFTVYWTFANGELAGPFGTISNPATQSEDDYEIQGQPVNCDTGEPIEPTPPDCTDFEITNLFSIANKTEGARDREWYGVAPAEPFTDDASLVEAFLEGFDYSAAPTSDAIVTSNVFWLNDADNTANSLGVQRRDGWICLQEPIEIEFGTTSEGYIGFWLGTCGGEQERLISFAKSTGFASTPRVVIPRGIHSVRIDNVDWGGTSSSWPVYRVEGGVATIDNKLMDKFSSPTQPYEICKQVKVCKPDGLIIDLLTDKVVDKSTCYTCTLKCDCGCSQEPLMIDKPNDEEICDFTVEFKSAGLTSVISDKGEALPGGPYDFSSTTGPSPEMTAAQSDIQAFLDANGGGVVTLSYPSDSILRIVITGTSCMFTTADDDSNPGPHEFTKVGQ